MLIRQEIERAVTLQAKGYRLLQWLEKAFDDGFIAPEAVHRYGTMEESAYAWIRDHAANLPPVARPDPEDLRSFSNLFSTYLSNTFDLDTHPGDRLFSPDAHCFCPICSWMVRVPHLRPKKLGPADKKKAENMKRKFILALAAEKGLSADEALLVKLLQNADLREPAALTAYAADLLQRLEGIAIGPASLALWRGFAWTPAGSPKKGFVLSADAIMNAQQTLLDRLSA